jgi:Late embryogenesis abundant protein
MTSRRSLVLLLGTLLLAGCASLGSLASAVQPPTFQVASGREAEIRLLGPSVQNPLGGASVRLWADITNPNPFGVVLSALTGSLALEGTRAADVDFPWGLPLVAGQDTVVPLDVSVSFADLPGLGNVLSRAVTEGAVDYSLDGTVTLDAGLLGQPSFGPTNFMRGSIRTRR